MQDATAQKESAGNELAQRRHEQILSAALEVFAKNGYRRTTIDDIAGKLNVGKGTIYRYFADKEQLFLAVYEEGLNRLKGSFDQNVLTVADPKERICAAVRNFFTFFQAEQELIEIQMQVRSEFKDDYRRIFVALYSEYIVRIQNTLREGIKSGIFRELDVEKTAETISGTLQGILQSFYVRELEGEKEGSEAEKLTDRIEPVSAMLLHGLMNKDSE